MKISVKILFGDERPFEVTSTMSVLELKGLVNEKCNIPVANQKLLLNGRALVDSKVLSEYGIQEGSKINVFVSQPLSGVSAIGESLPATTPPAPTLHNLLYNKLRLFYSDEDSLKVADQFMNDFYARIASMSLDDIERMATEYLEEDRLAAVDTGRKNVVEADDAIDTDETIDTDDDNGDAATIDHNAATDESDEDVN